jgi:arginyl-tRNA synthetase
MIKDRNIPEEQKKLTARAIAFGAMKFWILLQDSEKKITFDREQALSFEGETGPYLQYTYARISSILRKAQEMFPSENVENVGYDAIWSLF